MTLAPWNIPEANEVTQAIVIEGEAKHFQIVENGWDCEIYFGNIEVTAAMKAIMGAEWFDEMKWKVVKPFPL